MGRYLLDTMAVLWMAFRPDLLGKDASRILADSEAELHYSVASLWEIGLKLSVGDYRECELPDNWDHLLPAGLSEQGVEKVEILPEHCRLIQGFAFHHRDPFDRMLIAQALNGGWTVIGTDGKFEEYGLRRVW